MKILLPDDQADSESGIAYELQKTFPEAEFITYSEELLLKLTKSDNEIRYEKIFKSSPVPGFIWNFDGKSFTLVDVNDAAGKLTEGTAGNSIGMNAEEMYPGRRDIVERMEFCLKKRRKVIYETDYFNSGIQMMQKITFSYVSENLVLLHMEDITEYVKTQQEVLESEKKFRSLISEMDQGLALHEPIFNEKGKMVDFRFVEVNKSFEKQTGLKGQDIRGKTLKEVLPGSEEEWIEVYEQVVKNGRITHFEKYSKELNRYYEVVAYRNRKHQFATVVTDITERKNYMKELNLHNERLEALTKILKHDFKNSEDLLQFTLSQAIKLTESRYGFLFYYNEQTQKFSLQAWSEGVKKALSVSEERLEYELENRGCLSESVRQRKPLIINNYAEDNSCKRGLWCDHINMKRFLTVPVIVEDHVKAVVEVSNKELDYTETDVRQVTLLMDTLWKVVERNQHNEKLMKAKEKAEESDRLNQLFWPT
ncbi:MAG: GAF domain-containing protein [Prolixibacteraceae bacterium]